MATKVICLSCIYKVTNLINDKVYIGLTIDFTKRKKQHINNAFSKSYKYNSVFYKAIRKYNVDNFKWEIIFTTTNKDILNEIEIYFIKKFNTQVPNGYNMTEGGCGIKNGRKIKGKEHYKYNHKIYTFYHKQYAPKGIQCTNQELVQKYLLDRSHLWAVIKGIRKRTKNWCINKNLI